MHCIEAPQTYDGEETSLFLAGGITGCPDWQQEMIMSLGNISLVIFNPRRAQFLSHKDAAKEQIIWEHAHLRKATAISFWFPQETLCPITLYELGAWSMTDKKIFVGTHPAYEISRCADTNYSGASRCADCNKHSNSGTRNCVLVKNVYVKVDRLLEIRPSL